MQQAVDLTTGEQVAIKFIERSQEVRGGGSRAVRAGRGLRAGAAVRRASKR